MATVTERLLLLIDADAGGAIAGLDATGTAAEKNLTPIEARAQTATAGTLALGAAGVLVGGAIEAGLGKADSAYVNLGTQTRQIQRLTGDTAEDASGLIAVAQRSGVSFDALNTGITRVSKNSEKLSDIGVSLNDDTGQARPFVDVLGDIADYFQAAPAGFDKTAEAVNLFGRGGTAMLPILDRGSAGIKDLTDQAKSMGLVLGQDDVDQIVKHTTAQRELQQAAQATRDELGEAADPAITEGLTLIGDVVKGVATFLHDNPFLGQLVTDAGLVVGALAIVGGALAVGSFAVQKIASGYASLGKLLGIGKGELVDTSGATQALSDANARATETANLLAEAEGRVADSAALAGATPLVAAATIPVAAAGAGAADAGTAGVQAEADAVRDLGLDAVETGAQLELAFGTDVWSDGLAQLALFDGAVLGVSKDAGLIAEAMDDAAAQVAGSSAEMSAELQSAFAGGILGAETFRAAAAGILTPITAEAADMRVELASAFSSGLVPLEAFDGLVLKTAGDMALMADAANAALDHVAATEAADAAAVTASTATADAGATTGGLAAGGVVGGALGAAKSAVGPAILAVVGYSIGQQVANAVTGGGDALDKATKDLEAKASSGGSDVVGAFITAAQKKGATLSASDLFPTHVFDDLFETFNLGGQVKGPQQSTQEYQSTFNNLLSTSGTSAAQSFVDSLKQDDAELDKSSNDYKESEQLVRKWQKAIDDAKASADAHAASTKADGAAVDAFGFKVDSSKTLVGSFAEGLQADAGAFEGVINGQTSVQQANQSVTQDQKQLATDEAGGTGDDPSQQADAIASASQQVDSSNRSEAQSTRDLASARSQLAEAQASAQHDPGSQADADAVSKAEAQVEDATDGTANARDAAASSERSLNDARANAITLANQLADAEDKINSATRSEAEARRSLSEGQTQLSEDEATLAHTSQANDPRAFQSASDKVQQDKDAVANQQDSVANASDQTAAAQRNKLQVGAQQQADQGDKVAADKAQTTRDQNTVAEAALGLVVAEAQLADVVKSDPHALPALKAQIEQLAATGIIPQATADNFVNQLDAAAASAKGLGDTIDLVSGLAAAAASLQAGVSAKLGSGGGFAGLGPPASSGVPSGSVGFSNGNSADDGYNPAAGGKVPAKGVTAEPKTIQAGPVIGSTIVEGSDKHWYYVNPADPSKLISQVPGRVAGGPVSAGQMYEGGEQGFEIIDMGAGRKGFIPGRDGTVQPHDVAAKTVADAAGQANPGVADQAAQFLATFPAAPDAGQQHTDPAGDPWQWSGRSWTGSPSQAPAGGVSGPAPEHRADGGATTPGHLYEVAEGGQSELLLEGGRTLLIPGAAGQIVPATALPTSAVPEVTPNVQPAAAAPAAKWTPAVDRTDELLAALDKLTQKVDELETGITVNNNGVTAPTVASDTVRGARTVKWLAGAR